MKLTRAGQHMLVAAAVLLAVSVLLRFPELGGLGLAAAATLGLALAWMRTRPAVDADRTLEPKRVAEGGEVKAVLTVTNSGARRSPPLLVIERLDDEALPPWSMPGLNPHEQARFSYLIPAKSRGVYTVPAPTVTHTDPLRLVYAGVGRAEGAVLYVHPATHRVLPLPAMGPREYDGRPSLTSPAGGDDFNSLREFVPGDDWRLIHWRSFARTGTLVVRHNVVPVEPQNLIVLDTSAEAYQGSLFEDAVRVAASLCHSTVHAGFALELRTTSGDAVTVEPMSTRSGRSSQAALDLLAGVRAVRAGDGGTRDLSSVISDASAATLVVVTGRTQPAHSVALAAAEGRFATICLAQLVDRALPGGRVGSGVHLITAASSLQFARTWNAMAQR